MIVRWVIAVVSLFFFQGLFASASFERVKSLPPELKESSGLVYVKPYLWTIVDSTDTRLYALSPVTGQVVKKVLVKGVENHDWESIARDDRYLYIGDVGNNAGNRRDIAIYRLPLTTLRQAVVNDVKTFHVNYYAYTPKLFPYAHDFDAEALLVSDKSILVVTKNWRSGGATLYRLPKRPGRHEARPFGRLHFSGMVTAASWEDNVVSFLSYQPGLFGFRVSLRQWMWPGGETMWASSVFHTEVLPVTCQAEGLTHTRDKLWVTCEGNAAHPAQLFVGRYRG